MRQNRRALQRSVFKSRNDAGSDGQDVPGNLRRRLGRWLRDKRAAVEMTQRDLAEQVGLDRENSISAIENGRANIQPERYATYCDALGLDPEEFATVVLRHTDPWLYKVIFDSRDQSLLDELAMMASSVRNAAGGLKKMTDMTRVAARGLLATTDDPASNVRDGERCRDQPGPAKHR